MKLTISPAGGFVKFAKDENLYFCEKSGFSRRISVCLSGLNCESFQLSLGRPLKEA